jgi:hypothetical protein
MAASPPTPNSRMAREHRWGTLWVAGAGRPLDSPEAVHVHPARVESTQRTSIPELELPNPRATMRTFLEEYKRWHAGGKAPLASTLIPDQKSLLYFRLNELVRRHAPRWTAILWGLERWQWLAIEYSGHDHVDDRRNVDGVQRGRDLPGVLPRCGQADRQLLAACAFPRHHPAGGRGQGEVRLSDTNRPRGGFPGPDER